MCLTLELQELRQLQVLRAACLARAPALLEPSPLEVYLEEAWIMITDRFEAQDMLR